MKLNRYRKFFSPAAFWSKLRKVAAVAGTKTLYSALLLYFAYERKETPAWAKKIIIGALGYLIMPLDLIPDPALGIGLTDDIAIIGTSLLTIAAYVNDEVRRQAKETLGQWFPNLAEEDLREVEEKLK